MERTTKMMKHKGIKRGESTIKYNKDDYFSELHKLRTKTIRKCSENKLMVVQLHHFANLTKSTTATKVGGTLNLTGQSKAILENDFFQIIHAKQPKNTEFLAKPFVINNIKNKNSDVDKIQFNCNNNTTKQMKHNYCKKEFKDLVSKKLKAKDRLPRNPFAVACRDINSMISIKDYHQVFCKKIFETRLFVNGVLIYDKLKQHYSGISVAPNCLKKKFVNRLNKATAETFPEMETLRTTTNNKENRLLQNVIEFYDHQENDINLFNKQLIQIPLLLNKNNNNKELIVEDPNNNEYDVPERSQTPENDNISPESFATPPSQRLIPVDLSASTASKYQPGFYQKDPKSGKTSVFEIPQSFQVTRTDADKSNKLNKINRSVKRSNDLSINCDASCSSKVMGFGENARFVEPRDPLKSGPKKRLFQKYSNDDDDDSFCCRPLNYRNIDAEGNVFVRPIYSPKEFTDVKKIHSRFSPHELVAQKQTLKVDELDFFDETLKNISKIKTPEHRYFPYVQFERK